MGTILTVLEDLARVSGRLEKEKLLKTHETNLKLQKVFQLTYGEQRYGVHPSEILKTEGVLKRKIAWKINWKAFKSLTTNLVERKITGNKAKNAVNRFLTHCSSLERKWYFRILNRDLEINVSTKTIEKIWPTLLKVKTEFNGCMLAKEFVAKTFFSWRCCYVEPKCDGIRAIALVKKEGVNLLSRRGKLISHLPHIEKELAPFKNRMFDGEVVVYNSPRSNPNRVVDWKATLSLAKARVHVPPELAKRIENCVEFHIFDTMGLNQYLKQGSSEKSLKKRKEQLKPLKNLKCVKIIKFVKTHNIERIYECYEDFLAQGYEGAIIKNPKSVYSSKRSTSWMKIKPTRDKSGVIVGFNSGKKRHAPISASTQKSLMTVLNTVGDLEQVKKGILIKCKSNRYEKVLALLKAFPDDQWIWQRLSIRGKNLFLRTKGRLGSLQVKTDKSKIINVSGFSDILREQILDNRKYYSGKTIDYKEQRDPGNTGITRFSRFIRFREEI